MRFTIWSYTSARLHHVGVCSRSARSQRLSYSLSILYSICATTALKLQPALGTPRGGPRTEQATEAGSQLIGSCVSGTQRQCQSQHFPSLFPRPPLLFPPSSSSSSIPVCQPQTPQAWHHLRTRAWANMYSVRCLCVFAYGLGVTLLLPVLAKQVESAAKKLHIFFKLNITFHTPNFLSPYLQSFPSCLSVHPYLQSWLSLSYSVLQFCPAHSPFRGQSRSRSVCDSSCPNAPLPLNSQPPLADGPQWQGRQNPVHVITALKCLQGWSLSVGVCVWACVVHCERSSVSKECPPPAVP